MIYEAFRLFHPTKKFWTLEIIRTDVPYTEQEPVFSRSYTNRKNAEKAARRELAKWNEQAICVHCDESHDLDADHECKDGE
tara:strand:+ start:864 stop:1106 length:243 start_codon:yes stop_codon:yes gene_type:complete